MEYFAHVLTVCTRPLSVSRSGNKATGVQHIKHVLKTVRICPQEGGEHETLF